MTCCILYNCLAFLLVPSWANPSVHAEKKPSCRHYIWKAWVYLLVLMQFSSCGKWVTKICTLLRPLYTRPFMLIENWWASKCLLTNITPVRSFSCVCPLMDFQLYRLNERLAAISTLVRPFTCVCPNVYSQVWRWRTFLVAKVTHIRLFFCVCLHMSSQVWRSTKSLVANVTHMRLVSPLASPSPSG